MVTQWLTLYLQIRIFVGFAMSQKFCGQILSLFTLHHSTPRIACLDALAGLDRWRQSLHTLIPTVKNNLSQFDVFWNHSGDFNIHYWNMSKVHLEALNRGELYSRHRSKYLQLSWKSTNSCQYGISRNSCEYLEQGLHFRGRRHRTIIRWPFVYNF